MLIVKDIPQAQAIALTKLILIQHWKRHLNAAIQIQPPERTKGHMTASCKLQIANAHMDISMGHVQKKSKQTKKIKS